MIKNISFLLLVMFCGLILSSSVYTSAETQQIISTNYKSDILSCLQDKLDSTYSLDVVEEQFSFSSNGIVFICDKGVKTNRLYENVEKLSLLGTDVINNVNEIYFSDENLNDVVKNVDFSKYGDNPGGYLIAGYASGHKVCINVNIDEGDTLIHEIAHVYDKYNDGISKREEFISIYDNERALVGKAEYKAITSAEFFAIASDLYFRENDYVKENMPETYDYLFSLYNSGQNKS